MSRRKSQPQPQPQPQCYNNKNTQQEDDEADAPSIGVPATEEERRALVGDFKAGSIRRIKLENFLTYDLVEIFPGPRLNMVVGANGTGKSSVLNAICLGLGGEPKILGRADDARAFIKHGKEIAMIEIELEPNEEVDEQAPIFRRVIDRNRGTERGRGRGASTFYLNDQQVSRDQIHDVVQNQYNISLANLCTFLPQDKVGSFSGMTAQELLIETEKTLHTTKHLYATHQALIDAEEDLLKQAGQAGTVPLLEHELERVTRDLANLERAKQKLEERERALKQIDLLKKKRLWMQVDHLQEKALKLKDEKKFYKEKIKEAQVAIDPLNKKAAEISEERRALELEEKKCQKEQAAALQECEKQEKKYLHHDDEIEGLLAEASDVDNRKEELKLRLKEAETATAKYAANLADTQLDENDLQQKVQENRKAHQESREAGREMARLHREQHTELSELEQQAQRLQQKLSKQEDARLQQEQAVFRKFPQLEQIRKIVQQHAADFRKPVHGPVACLVTPKPGTEKQHASFLEQHVQKALWKGFVVETKQDQDLLYRLVREERNIPINIFIVDRITPEIPRPYGPERMKQFKRTYGIAGFLDEMFTAPAPIMQALRTQCMIHQVLSGSEKTQECIDSQGLLDTLSQRDPEVSNRRTGLQNSVVCCNNADRLFKYTIRISEYSGKPSTRIDQVKPATFLQAENEEATQLAQQLKQQLEQVHDQLHTLRPKLEETKTQKENQDGISQELYQRMVAWADKQTSYTRLVTKHQQAQSKLKDIQNELSQLSESSRAEKARLLQHLQKRGTASITVLCAHDKANKQFLKHSIRLAAVQLQKSKITVRERQIMCELEEVGRSFEEVKNAAICVTNEFNEAKKKFTTLKAKAEAEAPLDDENGQPLELRTLLEALEFDTVDDIEAAVDDCEQKAKEIQANPRLIQQYLDKVKEHADLKAKLEDAKASRAAKLSDIEAKRTPWQTALENNTEKINSLFTVYMAEMGCTGEVRLKKGANDSCGNPANFKDWGIEILVSFREGTKAQVLSAKVQSGGERSVSTIMYLMALQDMMVAPFRCVDEINQGLDDRNERLVFRRIVENSTKQPSRDCWTNHSGQYFLITPKLLPNLYDMEEEAVTILFVFNGKYNFRSPTEWNVDIIVGRGGGDADDDQEKPNEPIVKRRRL